MNFSKDESGVCMRGNQGGRLRAAAGVAIAMFAGCHTPDSTPGPGEDRAARSTAAQAVSLDETAGRGARFAVRPTKATGSGRRFAAALGPPPPIPSSTQFDIVGFLQEAHTSGPGTAGTAIVNGQIVTIPANTVVILPASALTWDELFTQAPEPYLGSHQTGLALFDTPAPLVTSEIHIIGNRVTTAPGGDAYIAGLVYLSQQSLNSGAGFINFIDYELGELRVGGAFNDPQSGTRVRINDPVIDVLHTGRYSKGQTPDRRFTVDQDNPTIMSATGFPMCLPRIAPPAGNGLETDPLCPQGNRPIDPVTGALALSFHMAVPADGVLPDARIQAPLEIGDYVTFAGIQVTDNAAAPTAGPWPGLANTYVSAYSIIDNTAIYTAPGSDPAYVQIEVTLVGTGGLSVAGAAEVAARTRFEGFTTDPSRAIHLYAIDLDPATGDSTDRDLGTILPDSVAFLGRWRFRPPCAAFGSTVTDKVCVMNQAGTFLPPTREVRAVIEGQQGQVLGPAQTAANGLVFGQYHAPVAEYIFPETVPGAPIVPNNFDTMPFLACGGATLSDGSIAGSLAPWPGATVPVCANAPIAPVASAGAALTVAAGATVTLAGTASGTAPLTFSWVQTAGPSVVLSSPAIATPSFVAPVVTTTTQLGFQLTVTNAVGSSTSSVTVTVNASTAPTINHVPARTVVSGTAVSLTATCSDPGGLSCTFTWTQTAGAPVVLSPNPITAATVSFQVQLPAASPATTLQFSIVATNAAGVASAPDTTSVTITAPADVVTITNADYRAAKQRLDLTATSSVVSPTLDLLLQPYVTTSGARFDPAGLGNLFTNAGGGNYTITLLGVPPPASPPATPLTARSTAGGVSAPHGLDRIR